MNQKERMLRNLPYKAWLDGLPEGSGVLPPLRCDFGSNIFPGNHLEDC